MSIEYKCVPPILFDTFIEKVKLIEVSEPNRPHYVFPHRLLSLNGIHIWAYSQDGNLEFEVYGVNKPDEIFTLICKQFNVKIISEYFDEEWS